MFDLVFAALFAAFVALTFTGSTEKILMLFNGEMVNMGIVFDNRHVLITLMLLTFIGSEILSNFRLIVLLFLSALVFVEVVYSS